MSIYERWGLQPIINASGSVTRLGGAPMPPRVLEAYCQAAEECVPLDQLQAAASRRLAEVTGAEAGLVTAGCSAALLLGTAAILAGYDVVKMQRLPHCDGMPCEFVVAREQRNGYDHAVRAAGARLVDVGFHEIVAGAGVRRVECWEFRAAFGPLTAGVLYVYGPDAQPDLQQLVTVAHGHGLPVLVDAAGELPPSDNLRRILETGADLVAFSGGKGLRGPQSTGILCGRRDLIGSAALQMLDLDDHQLLWDPPESLIDRRKLQGFPRHGIGRALKVSKEQIVALLVALDLFLDGSYQSELRAQRGRLEQIAAKLPHGAADCRIVLPHGSEGSPVLEIALPPQSHPSAALEICRALRSGSPAIFVGHGQLAGNCLVIHPLHLNDEQSVVLAERLCGELRRFGPTSE